MKSTQAIQDPQQLDLFIENGGEPNGVGVRGSDRWRQVGTHESRAARLVSPAHQLEIRPGRRIRVARQVSSSLYIFKGFEVQRESASPAPAQLAGGVAGSAAGSTAGSTVGDSHKTKPHRAAPRHASPRRVRRVVKSKSPVAVIPPPASPTASPGGQRSKPAPMTSAALSYVFVAVTLACTFLV